MSLGKMLTESAENYAENAAVIHGEKRFTYRELNRAACALGNHLRSLGLGKGDKVALMLPNCPEFVIAYFGIQKIGGVAVTLNVQSTPYELHASSGQQRRAVSDHAGVARRSASKRSGRNSPSAATSSRPTARRRIPPSGRSSPKVLSRRRSRSSPATTPPS